MPNIVFEDHTWRRLRPLCWSLPTYELRCGLFNTRERIELLAPDDGALLLCREILEDLHTAPGWTTAVTEFKDRTLWLNGRLAPDAALIAALHRQRESDWLLRDEAGILAAAVPASLGQSLLDAWRQWRHDDGEDGAFAPPPELASLPTPELTLPQETRDLGWIWDLVPATSRAISGDLKLVGAERQYARHPFGLFPAAEAGWRRPGSLRRVAAGQEPARVHLVGSGGLYLGSGGVELAPGTHIETSGGPVVLDGGVRVMAHAYLEGPLYIGRETIVKPGARLYGESSFGVGNRLAGEIGESTFGEFANKQHDGFIGHAVLGSWINLGAMTTCSDLKNNYGSVRVNLGEEERDTGQRFVGLMMGDHAKSAIGSLFNTGTTVGFASNVFGGAMPPKYVANFSWGGAPDAPIYGSERARQTAQIVLQRRGCTWTPAHDRLFVALHDVCSGS